VNASATSSSTADACVQNSESDGAALVSAALELPALDDGDDADSSSPEPPQAVSRTTAAAVKSPPRHATRVRRMGPRLTAGGACVQASG
jgi:hypothetical protein